MGGGATEVEKHKTCINRRKITCTKSLGSTIFSFNPQLFTSDDIKKRIIQRFFKSINYQWIINNQNIYT